MKQLNAYHTAARVTYDAASALKPAIMDLAATQDDHALETVAKVFIQLRALHNKMATRAHRAHEDEHEI